MIKFLTILFFSSMSFAGGNLYRQAKDLAYRNPKIMTSALIESLTHKCTNYITADKPDFYKKFYVLDCYHISNDLFKILDLYPFEVEKGTVLPISFSTKLLEFANNKNIITFLKFFNSNVSQKRISFLKTKVPELLSMYTSYEEFLAVLFQDTSPSHLLFLKKYASSESYEVIKISNRLFFQSLANEEEQIDLFGDKTLVSNPYHFYVIRHLSKTLSKQYKYELSAFVSYLFNYSYEIFENDFRTSLLVNDPDKLNIENFEDILLGLKGAYYKDSINSNLAQNFLKTSNTLFLKELAQRLLSK